MRIRLIGCGIILAGLGLLAASPLFQNPPDRTYVYPPGAQENAYPGDIPSSDSQLIVNDCPIPHETIAIEVSEAEAKKLREEAGYSSEGVSGGVLVQFKETGVCPQK